MDFRIKGENPLTGKIKCDGAKNAALPVMAACLLSESPSILHNIPRLRDIDCMISVLEGIGVSIRFAGSTMRVDPGRSLFREAPFDPVREMRASFLVMGPLLVRCGSASAPLPGGCAIGQRPVDLHLKGFQSMGADIMVEKGFVKARARRLKGASIYLDVPSVGATENIMMAASRAHGETIIDNAAQEPEVVDLANFLNAMGAQVKGAGTARIRIQGVKELNGTSYTIVPDRIEASTYLIAAAITGGKISVEGVVPTHLRSVTAKLRETGARILECPNSIELEATGRPLPASVKTLPYPGFPTDVQAPFMSLCCLAQGTSVISETIFENRFSHALELSRMGAKIRTEGSNAIVEGVPGLQGAILQARDLRAGAALCLAALAAKGESLVRDTYHIERGYAGFAEKLRSMGADIQYDGSGASPYLKAVPK